MDERPPDEAAGTSFFLGVEGFSTGALASKAFTFGAGLDAVAGFDLTTLEDAVADLAVVRFVALGGALDVALEGAASDFFAGFVAAFFGSAFLAGVFLGAARLAEAPREAADDVLRLMMRCSSWVCKCRPGRGRRSPAL